MSDGNFNRALLPSTPYRSGVKMGYQQAKAQATTVLSNLLQERCPEWTSEQRQAFIDRFKAAF